MGEGEGDAMRNMLPTDKWDYDAKPLLPGTRLHVEWVTYPPGSRTFLLEVTHVAGDDTGQTLLMTRQDARGLRDWLDAEELGGPK